MRVIFSSTPFYLPASNHLPCVCSDNNPIPMNPDGSLKTADNPSFKETWAEMEEILANGKVKAIGVSNFSIKTYV
jgi:diketogulonate reductase-like aldo/keto reductase